MGHAE
jgi:hypothetical protein